MMHGAYVMLKQPEMYNHTICGYCLMYRLYNENLNNRNLTFIRWVSPWSDPVAFADWFTIVMYQSVHFNDKQGTRHYDEYHLYTKGL